MTKAAGSRANSFAFVLDVFVAIGRRGANRLRFVEERATASDEASGPWSDIEGGKIRGDDRPIA